MTISQRFLHVNYFLITICEVCIYKRCFYGFFAVFLVKRSAYPVGYALRLIDLTPVGDALHRVDAGFEGLELLFERLGHLLAVARVVLFDGLDFRLPFFLFEVEEFFHGCVG